MYNMHIHVPYEKQQYIKSTSLQLRGDKINKHAHIISNLVFWR